MSYCPRPSSIGKAIRPESGGGVGGSGVAVGGAGIGVATGEGVVLGCVTRSPAMLASSWDEGVAIGEFWLWAGVGDGDGDGEGVTVGVTVSVGVEVAR